MDELDKLIIELSKERSQQKAGFKLLYFEVKENPYLQDLKLRFTDRLDALDNYPFNTVIIGPNGTGKSNILRAIINVFRELHHLKMEKQRINSIQGGFAISYISGGTAYAFSNITRKKSGFNIVEEPFKKIWGYINETETKDFSSFPLPDKIIANSIMITDKFPFLKDGEFPNYIYLGVRSSRASSGTKAYIRKTVDIIQQSLSQDGFLDRLKDILNYLDLENSLTIYYKPIYKSQFYRGDLTIDDFKDYFTNQKKHFPKRTTDLWGTKYYKSIANNDERIKSIVDFLNRLHQTFFQGPDASDVMKYNVVQDNNIVNDFKMIQHLKGLDIITYPWISLQKKGSAYSLEDSSSGEYHLLSSLIGLMASVVENSLVLIDEPEVSLHPNWQMKYMDYLKNIFEGRKSCHFIVTTHSHFIISDLNASNSQIIGLKKNEILDTVHFDNYNTFGWSAEDVLYNIFDVVTTRNFFVAREIGSILKEIANKNINEKKIKSHKTQLAILKNSLKENDPMRSLIIKIEKEFISE